MGKFSQYRQSFREEWKTDPLFQNWIESVKDDIMTAYCKCCHIFIPAHYAGLTNHASSTKHCKSIAKNEKKLLQQSLSLSDLPKKHDGLCKQSSIRKPSQQAGSSGEAAQKPDVRLGMCTLELTVDDDMTCQQENGCILQMTNLEAGKKKMPKTALINKDNAAQGFEITDGEFATNSEDRKLAINGKPGTSVCDEWLQHQMLQDAICCKPELNRNVYEHCSVNATCDANKVATRDSVLQDVTQLTDITPNADELPSEKEDDTVPALNSVQKYLVSWNTDPMLCDWVAPVAGNVSRAQCRWCQVELPAHYKDLKHHVESAKHATNALMYNVESKTKGLDVLSSLTEEEPRQQTSINSLRDYSVTPAPRADIFRQSNQSKSNQPNGTGSSIHKPKALKSKVFVQPKEEQDIVSCKEELSETAEETDVCGNKKAKQIAVCTVTSSVDPADWMSQPETSAVCTDDSAVKKHKGNEDDDPMQVKRYPQKYVMRWNSDPVLRDWVAPVAGNVYRARCRWCRVELRAHYKDLKHHAGSTKHATSALMHDEDFEAKYSAEESSLTDEESVEQGPSKRLKTTDSTSERKSKQNPCYFLSRSSWDRYKQKYRKAWESDPNFRGWIAPVEGDIFKARCLYCRVLIRAHHKDLKEHSKTTKHATNVGYGLPYNNSQLNDASTFLPKPRMLKRRVIARRKRKQGLTRGPCPLEIGQEDCLLKPDDSLASIESLVSLANMSCLSQPESTITTLVFPNATQLDESVAAALPNNPKTLYRVKKLSSAIGAMPTKKSKVSEDSDLQDQMTRLVRKVTLWEFLKMKVERNNGGLRIPAMLSEFESLHDQIIRVTKERLEPVNLEDNSEQQGLKPDTIMVLSSDRLAKLLCMPVGHYHIKDSAPHLGDGKSFSVTKKPDKSTPTVSADGSSLISTHSVENCIPADGLQSSIFSDDHVGQPEDVLTNSELVFPSTDHIIHLQDTDCLTPNADNSTQVFTNPDGTLLIHVSGPQRQIPLDVIQYLFAGKGEDSRRLHSTTGDLTAVLP